MAVKRFALTEDIPALRALWLAAFPGDTEQDCRPFFEPALLRYCLIAEQDGVPASMVFCLPAMLGNRRLQYIYAAATLPVYRGRGLFGELLCYALELAKNEGCVGSFLHPAQPSLTEYYARFGYRPWTYCERVCGAAGKMLPIGDLTPQAYTAQRAALLPTESLLWPSWFTELAAQNDKAYTVGKAVALCCRTGNTLRIKELLGDGDPSALCAACGCTQYELVRPAAQGEVYTLYAAVSAELPPPYIGPVLD